MAWRPWLPANAVLDTRLGEALGGEALTWAKRWFGEPRSPTIRMNEVKGRTGLASEALCWRHRDGGLTLSLHPNAHVTLAGAMLGVDCTTQKLRPNDVALLRALASICARDFLHHLAPLFDKSTAIETSSERETDARLRFSLSLGPASQLLDLFVDEEEAIVARRNLLSSAPEASLPRGARSQALASQPIEVGAMIGVAALGLGELRTLGEGDILVLDRGPSDGLSLSIDGRRRAQGCTIVQDEQVLKLRIENAEGGGLQ